MFDECSYAIGAQLLARGHLWLPQHPLGDFFDSFFLVARPVYSSIYFPGAALAFAPGVLFGWPTWVVPVVLSGISVGLLYRIVTALTGDGAAGLLAALWLVSLMAFRALSVMTMSHIVLLTLGLLIVWAWIRWREQRKLTWALAIGAASGWAAITRPVDALAYAIPVGIAMAAALRGRPAREWLTTATMLMLGAAPFLALQVTHNVGVTGNPLRTPYTDYLAREQPGAQFGVRKYDPSWRPASDSPPVQGYYNWVRGYLEHHQPHNFLRPWFTATTLTGGRVQPANLLTLADNTLPARPLLLLLPAGFVALAADRRRLVLAAVLPLFVLLYVLNPFFLPHYAVVVAPAMILLSLLGADALAQAAGPRWEKTVRAATMTFVFATAATSLWEVRWLMSPTGRPPVDGFQERVPQSFVQTAIEMQVQTPAVVLYGTPPDLWTEMVYNTDVAWPDDAAIIRAHDLGLRDAELIDYYGQRQPDRTIYQFDWRRGSLKRLGQAGELRERLRGSS
jgi:4-amino-4-deoxy-L-arabinose transferase-like glycosyltransferase